MELAISLVAETHHGRQDYARLGRAVGEGLGSGVGIADGYEVGWEVLPEMQVPPSDLEVNSRAQSLPAEVSSCPVSQRLSYASLQSGRTSGTPIEVPGTRPHRDDQPDGLIAAGTGPEKRHSCAGEQHRQLWTEFCYMH